VVTLAEARSYYEKNRRRSSTARRLACNDFDYSSGQGERAGGSDARKKAETILAQAKATKNYEQFGLLARKCRKTTFG